MTLLGASSAATDDEVRLAAAVDGGDAGVGHGGELAAFAEASWRRDETLETAREALRAGVGDDGVTEASLTVAIFRSLNLGADASGIPLDESFSGPTRGFVDTLGIDQFATARNSPGFSRT